MHAQTPILYILNYFDDFSAAGPQGRNERVIDFSIPCVR